VYVVVVVGFAVGASVVVEDKPAAGAQLKVAVAGAVPVQASKVTKAPTLTEAGLAVAPNCAGGHCAAALLTKNISRSKLRNNLFFIVNL
jgi:hypothetical protein